MQYDHIIQNGTVYDSIKNEFHKKDVYIKDGLIAAPPSPGDKVTSDFTVDASSSFVTPGFVDIHAHLAFRGSNIGAHPDLLCIPSGVTTAVDGGTTGWTNFEAFYMNTMIPAIPNIKAFLNVCSYGIKHQCNHLEDIDPDEFNYKRILALFKKYPNSLRGLKLRISSKTLNGYGLLPLKRTEEIAADIRSEGYFCNVVVHLGDLPDNMEPGRITDLLSKGDILCHCYQPEQPTIFDTKGKLRPGIKDARERGILFDSCHGRLCWSFANIRRGLENDFLPDVVSSDVTPFSMNIRPAFSLLYCINMYLAFHNIDVANLLRSVTYAPSAAVGITSEAGSLTVGRPADIAILELRESRQVYRDWFGDIQTADRMFVPLMTFRGGEPMFRQIFF